MSRLPVSSRKLLDGSFETTGLDYGEYLNSMQVQHRAETVRKLPIPEWSASDAKLRAVVVRFMELRAQIREPQPGTDAKRLRLAEARLRATRPRLEAKLDELCRRYADAKRSGDSETVRKLEIRIEGLDSQIRTLDHDAQKITAVAIYSWRLNMDSVGAAQATGLSPRSVRLLLHRLRVIGEQPTNNVGDFTKERERVSKSIGQRHRFEDPAERARQSAAQKKRWSNPSLREIVAAQQRQRWADPAFRARLVEAHSHPRKSRIARAAWKTRRARYGPSGMPPLGLPSRRVLSDDDIATARHLLKIHGGWHEVATTLVWPVDDDSLLELQKLLWRPRK